MERAAELVKLANPIGARVELIHTTDPYTHLKPGDRGTIRFVDSMGTVFIDWDNGSSLGLVPREDDWSVIKEGATE